MPSELTHTNWKIGKEKEVYCNSVKRLEGENQKSTTNLAYKTFERFAAELDEKAKAEMWTTEETAKRKLGWEVMSSGGIIELYILRKYPNAAQLKYFTVIIHNDKDVEIYRHVLHGTKVYDGASNDSWWNTIMVPLPEDPGNRFYVYVVDTFKAIPTRYKFEVNTGVCETSQK